MNNRNARRLRYAVTLSIGVCLAGSIARGQVVGGGGSFGGDADASFPGGSDVGPAYRTVEGHWYYDYVYIDHAAYVHQQDDLATPGWWEVYAQASPEASSSWLSGYVEAGVESRGAPDRDGNGCGGAVTGRGNSYATLRFMNLSDHPIRIVIDASASASLSEDYYDPQLDPTKSVAGIAQAIVTSSGGIHGVMQATVADYGHDGNSGFLEGILWPGQAASVGGSASAFISGDGSGARPEFDGHVGAKGT